MTTSELIAILRAADPSGNMKVAMTEDSSFEFLVSVLKEPIIKEITKSVVDTSLPSVELTKEDIGQKILII